MLILQQIEFMNRSGILFIVTSIVLVALTRLIPHPPNFTAVGAMAIFGGAVLSKRSYALFITVGALFLSDLLINNLIYSTGGFTFLHGGFYWTYLPFIVLVLMSGKLIQTISLKSVVGTSLFASVLFFLVSNFGSWLGNPLYPQTIEGLFTAYAAGVPFFPSTLVGDLFFCSVLFGAYRFAQVRFPQLALQKQ